MSKLPNKIIYSINLPLLSSKDNINQCHAFWCWSEKPVRDRKKNTEVNFRASIPKNYEYKFFKYVFRNVNFVDLCCYKRHRPVSLAFIEKCLVVLEIRRQELSSCPDGFLIVQYEWYLGVRRANELFSLLEI